MNRHDAHLIAEELYKVWKDDKPLGSEPLMTSDEAAAYLKMSPSHFAHIATRFPRARAGRRWLYPKLGIDKTLINNKL